MRSKQITVYDWMEDFEPILLENLNELLEAEGAEPLEQLHGGYFKDGKWVESTEITRDYRNYWHLYGELFTENLQNDSYQRTYFASDKDDAEWANYEELADEYNESRGYKHSDPTWGRNLVKAMRKTLRDHFTENEDGDGYEIVFWWCW